MKTKTVICFYLVQGYSFDIISSNQNIPVCLTFGKTVFEKVPSYLNPTILGPGTLFTHLHRKLFAIIAGKQIIRCTMVLRHIYERGQILPPMLKARSNQQNILGTFH